MVASIAALCDGFVDLERLDSLQQLLYSAQPLVTFASLVVLQLGFAPHWSVLPPSCGSWTPLELCAAKLPQP